MLLFGVILFTATAVYVIYRTIAYDPWEHMTDEMRSALFRPTPWVVARRGGRHIQHIPQPTEEIKPMTLPRDLLPDLEKGDRTDEVLSKMVIYDTPSPLQGLDPGLIAQFQRLTMPQPQWITSPGTWTTTGNVPMTATQATSAFIRTI